MLSCSSIINIIIIIIIKHIPRSQLPAVLVVFLVQVGYIFNIKSLFVLIISHFPHPHKTSPSASGLSNRSHLPYH